MFENPAKGWHGSYSTVGRSSAEKYHLILVKDLILQGRYKRRKIKDTFSMNKTQPKQKNKKEIKIDIFKEPPIKDKIEQIQEYISKRKKICAPNNAEYVPEKYKFHQHHHKELFNYNLILKQSKKYTPGSGNYNPKMDYLWKKTITGPTWDILSGRDKKVIRLKDEFDLIKDKKRKKDKNKKNETEKSLIKNNLTLDNIEHSMFKNDKNQILNINKRIITQINQKIYGVPMIKQTKRGNLPISYDLRIRSDKPFITKEIENEKIKEKDKDKEKIKIKEKINKKELINIIKDNNNNTIKPKEENDNQKIKKPKKINNCLDFSKSLSREQYDNLFKNIEISPFSMPNYSQVEPRCLTMVSYTPKIKKQIKKKLEGIDNTIFYNPDKVINKVNNHKEVSVPNFKIMVSRPDDHGPLPSYMINKFDRASLETMTQKGLKMNGYANVGFKTYTSSFYPKKSFNKIINYNLLNSDKFVDSNLDGLTEKIKNNKNLTKLIEYYVGDNEEDLSNNYTKFDAITFRTIHNKKKKRTKFFS